MEPDKISFLQVYFSLKNLLIMMSKIFFSIKIHNFGKNYFIKLSVLR